MIKKPLRYMLLCFMLGFMLVYFLPTASACVFVKHEGDTQTYTIIIVNKVLTFLGLEQDE